MDKDITQYLNDHLAGSSGALLLILKLADTHDQPEARLFFLDLEQAVETDQSLLEDLLDRIDQQPSSLMKVAGAVTARVAGIKLIWEQIEPGELGLFEALEIPALGVHGKRLLWIALMEIAEWFPEWNGIDFEDLELQAIQQRDNIEFWRLQAAAGVLVDSERRIGFDAI